jgi:HSP20 family protein
VSGRAVKGHGVEPTIGSVPPARGDAARGRATFRWRIAMNRTMIPKGHTPLATREGRLDPFFALQRGINRMFDDLWHGFDVPVLAGHRFPSLEVRDDDKAVRVIAELPGMGAEDVELALRDGILTLKGEKKTESEEKTDNGIVSERWFGRFERAVAVGEVDEAATEAHYENGVLTVTMPKVEKAKETGRKIPIATTTK